MCLGADTDNDTQEEVDADEVDADEVDAEDTELEVETTPPDSDADGLTDAEEETSRMHRMYERRPTIQRDAAAGSFPCNGSAR